jgi:hypothetical protein
MQVCVCMWVTKCGSETTRHMAPTHVYNNQLGLFLHSLSSFLCRVTLPLPLLSQSEPTANGCWCVLSDVTGFVERNHVARTSDTKNTVTWTSTLTTQPSTRKIHKLLDVYGLSSVQVSVSARRLSNARIGPRVFAFSVPQSLPTVSLLSIVYNEGCGQRKFTV